MFRSLVKPDFAALILRLMLASIFIAQGCLKISQFNLGTTWYRHTDEMAPAIQAAVAWSELICGIALAIGLATRLAALGFIVIMIGAIYKVTWKLDFTSMSAPDDRAFNVHEVGYEYNYAIMAMCISLIILGAGVLSVDHFLWRRMGANVVPPPTASEATAAAQG